MRHFSSITIVIVGLLAAFLPEQIAAAEPPPEVDFARDIEPIFSAHCVSCHGAKKQRNGLRLDRRDALLKGGDSGEPAVVPGKSTDSVLLQRILSSDAKRMMPPPSGKRLSVEEIALVRRWIDTGAAMPTNAGGAAGAGEHWSFKPVRALTVPQKRDPFIANPIDAFVLARLTSKGLTPSLPADRTTLIRRLFFDMHGLPPTPMEVKAFLDDKGSDAYAKLVERVLASPRYGERWAQHWLDVVRYGDTHGFETNAPRLRAWLYRDWVIRSLNEDKPYPRFVVEQLAGDTCGEDSATGFLVAGPALQYGQIGKDLASRLQARQDELHEALATTATAFLGLTVGCARCHNHKFDPVSQVDYYALQAALAGLHYGERSLPPTPIQERERNELLAELADIEKLLDRFEPLAQAGVQRSGVTARRNFEHFTPMSARFVRFTIEATEAADEPALDELEVYSSGDAPTNVALASAGAKVSSSEMRKIGSGLDALQDGTYGADKCWISAERGKGWIQIELPRETSIEWIVWSRDRSGVQGDRLPTKYRIEVANEPGVWRPLASSAERLAPGKEAAHPDQGSNVAASRKRRVAIRGRLMELKSEQVAFTARFYSDGPTHRLYRGDPLQKKEVVRPDVLSVLRPLVGSLNLTDAAPEKERRLALAKAIASSENPLTARVLVNRVWQHHFGAGIVATPSDFGHNGAPPTHPELLYFLADSFVRSGWSIKSLHRLILLSSTYRQGSAPRKEALAVDAETALLWRFPPHRLEAEAIRDSILATSGVLDLQMGGPGFLAFKPNSDYVRRYDPLTEWSPTEWRRMIYMQRVRIVPEGVFGAFDCPDASQSAPRRSRSTTAIQALNLFNSTFLVQQADLFAKRVAREAGPDVNEQVGLAFALALQRPPAQAERQACAAVAGEHGLAAVCRALFNANEFLFVP